jgi:hypothetical protein
MAFIAFLNRAERSQYIGFSFTAKKKKKPIKQKPMHCKLIIGGCGIMLYCKPPVLRCKNSSPKYNICIFIANNEFNIAFYQI